MQPTQTGNRPGVDASKAPEPALGNAPITGRRYYCPEFAEKEFQKMWSQVWLIAGLEDQLSDPGSYLTCELGRESVLCVRGGDQRIRAFYNVCQHRGNLLVHNEGGQIEDHFACTYHGWRYDMKGILNWVYCEEDFPESPCGKQNLVELPCELWGGFIWYSLNPSAAPLLDYLGPVASQLESYPLQQMRRTHWVTVEGEFNWKCVQDNFNESYHLPFVHPEAIPVMDETYQNCQFDLYSEGHCRMLMPGSAPSPTYGGSENAALQGMSAELKFWDLEPSDYAGRLSDMRQDLLRQKRQLGASKGYDFSNYSDEQLTDHYHYTVFPNLSLSMKPDGCIFLRANPHPKDPEKCLFDMWYLTLFPEGATEYFAVSMNKFVSIDDPAPHLVGKVGDFSCGPGIDQDVALWATQQRGLRSAGYSRECLSGQERRVRYFHETIDRYLES